MPSKILRRAVVDKSVLELARERMHHCYDIFDTVTVSFSGGKDSTAVLNLALEVARARKKLPLIATFHDEECIPLQTVDYVRRVSQEPDIDLRWFCLPIRHRNACSRKSPFWYPWDPHCPEKWVRPVPPEAITEFDGFRFGVHSVPEVESFMYNPRRYGRVATMLGIRADESPTRRWAVTQSTVDNYIHRNTAQDNLGNVYKVYPIYDWKTVDVWTAPRLFGWDYNAAYDLLDKFGLTPTQQRCAPPFGEQPMQNLDTFKSCFPEIWDKMHDRVPGAATAARYSRSVLYGFRDMPKKPDGMSWQDFIVSLLEKFDAEGRRINAKRIGGMLRTHYRKTKDPIVYAAPHPKTGLSWRFLLAIAVRGDFKQRRQELIELSGKDPAALRANYEAARRAEGV